MTTEASSSGFGDSSAHGDENSAVKNTARERRTTRSTSDRISIPVVRSREGTGMQVPRDSVKDFRVSANSSRESGVLNKRHRVPVIERTHPPMHDRHRLRPQTEGKDATPEAGSDVLSVAEDGDGVTAREIRVCHAHQSPEGRTP